MTLYSGMANELLIVDPGHPEDATTLLRETWIAALSVDPREPGRILCGTYGDGLLRSVDAGKTWTRVGDGVIDSGNVLSVAISPSKPDVVFAGTEPSAIFRSDDRGDTWRELPAFQDIPSKPHWSFPPKPETHHVRWIAPHPLDVDHLLVAVEAGALVQSRDGGETWQDRVPGGPIDTHTLCIHPDRPDRLISAAGDGFFESSDRGQSWVRQEEGLPYRYCYGFAIDAGDPDTVVMSVSPGAHRGHGRREHAHASLVRRHGDDPWEVVTSGLPDADGMTLSILAADPVVSGTFWALNNSGIYQSDDGARSWRRLDVPWKEEYLDQRPPALAVATEP